MITPGVTQQRYNFTAFGTDVGGSIAALLPAPEGLITADLAYVQKNCGLPDHPIDKFVGKNDSKKCTGKNTGKDVEEACAEIAVDTQIIATTAGGIHSEFWSVPCGEAGLAKCFKPINDAGDAAPRIFSSCFGDPEDDRDDDVVVTDREFAKAVAKGITLVSASGDNGAGKKLSTGKYRPNYPPSSPYVLAVGGTSFVDTTVIGDERAVTGGYSAGGFSAQFKRPSWQDAAVSRYLSSGVKLPKSGSYDNTGRAVPDIAALSGGDPPACWQTRYVEASRVEPTGWACSGGTSTSGPFVASLVAKLNAARAAKGQGSMGFINPWLYSTVANATGALYDVTSGDNKGYFAYAGWDAVTGLGTPNYAILESLALRR